MQEHVQLHVVDNNLQQTADVKDINNSLVFSGEKLTSC